jgi:cytoskeletal protein CcmA (bactofilin family)
MLAIKQDQVLMACPHCGQRQSEPRSAFSSKCKTCGQYFRIQDVLHPLPKAPDHSPRLKRITCFECGVELNVPDSAESTMCKWCSCYVDLHSYRITNAVAKNFKTKGALVIEPKGWIFNTETIAGQVAIKGKFHGKLTADESLTIYSGADIKGSLAIKHLIIPAKNHFHWPGSLKTGSAEIAGETTGTLHATGTVTLKATARWFGDLIAKNLLIEEGAVIVGKLRIGSLPAGEQPFLL